MYIRIAARAAHALGLHHNSHNQAPGPERYSRSSTWKSVRILDLIVGSALGRPLATRLQTTSIPTREVPNDHRALALDANFTVWNVVENILERLYQREQRNTSAVKELLSDLERWSQRLSPSSKSDSADPSSTSSKQHIVLGNMHVACSYYFAVMLATRPMLTAGLTCKLSAKSPTAVRSGGTPLYESTESSALSQTCIESAILTLQTCHEAFSAKMMLNNMCILR